MRLLTILILVGCSSKESDSGSVESVSDRPVLAPPDEDKGFQMAMYGTAPPFSEVWLCSVYPLPIDAVGLTAVQSVQYNQNEGMHHFTLSALGFSLSGQEVENPIAHGEYDCNDLYSDSAVMEDAIMVFGGQGDAEGEMSFPDGTVANVPSTIDVLHEVHFVNPTPDEVEVYSDVLAMQDDKNLSKGQKKQ